MRRAIVLALVIALAGGVTAVDALAAAGAASAAWEEQEDSVSSPRLRVGAAERPERPGGFVMRQPGFIPNPTTCRTSARGHAWTCARHTQEAR